VVFDEQFSTVMVDMSLDHDDTLKVWDTLLDNGYDRHQCLEEFDEEEPRVHIRHQSAGVPLSRPLSPPATTDNGLQNEIDPVVHVDSSTAIDAVPTQAEPETSYPTPNSADEQPITPLPLPSGAEHATQRWSCRKARVTERYREDYVMFSKRCLSKQTRFRPNESLSRVPGEVLNNQRLCSLRWDGFLSSLRNGSYGALLSYVQRNSIDGY
jgi:hypothetical protein